MSKKLGRVLTRLVIILLASGIVLIIIGAVQTKAYNYEPLGCRDIHTTIVYGGRRYLVTVYKRQCEYLKKHTKNLTELLDMLAIRTMECNRPNGDCKNYYDVGPFQINRIHKFVYNHSLYLIGQKRYKKLFIYQTNYALGLVRYRMQNFCDWKRSKTNKRRFSCLYRTYNGCIRGAKCYYRAGLAWAKREKIKQILHLF